MGLFLGVGDHVILEILSFGGLKLTARLWTLEGVSSVNEAMGLQLTLVGCGKATDVAQVVFGGTVGNHVALQGMLPLEAVATDLREIQFDYSV